jgi:vinculin
MLMSTGLTFETALQVSREVGGREKELTHQVHREILVRCLEQVKTLAPILICSMKIFIHIIAQG